MGGRVALYAGGDLEPAEAAAVEEHLGACAQCRDAAGGLRENLDMLRMAHREAMEPAHLAAIRTRVLERLDRPPLWRRLWLWGPAVALAAAVAIAILAMPPAIPPPPRVAWSHPSGSHRWGIL